MNTINLETILTFLTENPLATLSTVNEEHEPDGASIYFVIEKDFSIYFMTKTNTEKAQNVLHNEHVALTVTHDLTTAQITGIAHQIDEKESQGKTIINITNELSQKLNNQHTVSSVLPLTKHSGELMIIKIAPQKIDFRQYGTDGVQEKVILFKNSLPIEQ